MTLTHRVSLFFLTALGVVLVIYSLVLYVMAQAYLYHQLDDDLLAAFDTLVAAVEVESDDAKFEPADHDITSRTGIGRENIHWIVRNERGAIVAQSKSWIPYPVEQAADWHEPHPIREFRVVQRTLRAPQPKPASERTPLEHEALTVSVAVSALETQASLGWLAALLSIGSVLAWGIAAAWGQYFVRRALRPVDTMAREARSLSAAEPSRRLLVPGSRDELSELATAFNGLLDRLHGALERQERFAGDAAHQLRTPLTVLQGQLDVALRRPRTPAEYQELLDVLKSQTKELCQLVESLLFLARSGAESSAMPRERLELAHWLDAQRSGWNDHDRAKDLQVRSSAGAVWVETLPMLLGQLLTNLVDNALKYSPPGSPVEVLLEAEGETARISVTDRGPGIDAGDLPHLFEPFYRCHGARQSGVAGTGLGLSLAARIAALLGGELRVASRPGEGARFTLELPAAEVRAREEKPVGSAG